MGALKTLLNYSYQRFSSSVCLSLQQSFSGELTETRVGYYSILKNFIQGRLTYVYKNEGHEMAPSIPGQQEMLLVRQLHFLPYADLRKKLKRVFVGDVIVFKDPLDPERHLVRRVVADGGYEMATTDEKDDPFILDDEEFWVLSDNKDLKKGEAKDSRAFGPITFKDIVGRVIYRMQSAEDHGPIENSEESKLYDEAVLNVELDVDEMAKSFKS
ncbi:mitochondrial ATP-independent inner membrane protease subunit 2-like [Silene latifolia]|uniref:mitochondrial ATP-independent inner membrane protease subunit 2-like n=1 Tax=Silene latifolia TaxID=37657 RepID=UPI003D77C618